MKRYLPSNTLELLITQNCNMNCKYCFEQNKKSKDLTLESLLTFLQQENPLKKDTFNSDHFFLFGGEPFLNITFIEELIEFIESNLKVSYKKKRDLLQSISRNLITNGTLVDKHLDFIKKHDIHLQISLDGPEDINDKNRVNLNNEGTFKKVQKNLALLRENNIRYNIHGVLSIESYKNLTRILEFFLEETLIALDTKNLSKQEKFNRLRSTLGTNLFMLVIEEEITDDHIDTLLQQIIESCDFIINTPLLEDFSYEERVLLLKDFITRNYNYKKDHKSLLKWSCSAGKTMFCYDTNYNLYSCHRLATNYGNSNELHQLIEEPGHPSYKLYHQFQEIGNTCDFYSAGNCYTGFDTFECNWRSWCPVTYTNLTKNPFYIPSKYNTLQKELNRLVTLLLDYY